MRKSVKLRHIKKYPAESIAMNLDLIPDFCQNLIEVCRGLQYPDEYISQLLDAINEGIKEDMIKKQNTERSKIQWRSKTKK